MKALILFSLQRRFLNKITILINVLIFFAIFIVNNNSYLLSENSYDNYYYDSSLFNQEEYFTGLTELNYQYSRFNGKLTNKDILVKYTDNYVIVSSSKVDDKTIAKIKEDLARVYIEEYQNKNPFLQIYIKDVEKMKNEIEYVVDKETNYLWIIQSIIYFVILNYGTLISSEVLYEKTNHLLNMLLTNITAQQHIMSKLIIGYLTPLIQLVLIVVYIVVSQLFAVSNIELTALVENTIIETISISQCVQIISLIFSGLIIVQLILLFIVCKFSNVEQANSMQGLIYVIMLLIYGVGLLFLDHTFFLTSTGKILSFVPILSMLFMSYRILLKVTTYYEVLLAILINVLFVVWLLKNNIASYKDNVINISN